MPVVKVHKETLAAAASGSRSALGWLDRIAPLTQPLIGIDGRRHLDALDKAVGGEIVRFGGSGLKSSELLRIRRRLARDGFGALDVPVELGGAGLTRAAQCLAQFICGYHDVDLRDATGPGHGRMILFSGSDEQLARWRQAILSGSLIGVAVTEKAGGSSLLNIASELRPVATGGWVLSGEKTWISRFEEADALVVFARTSLDGELAALIIEPDRRGIVHTRIEPAGLRGWSWGRMRFDDVRVLAADVLAIGVKALSLFHEHFTYYRPLAAATAVGGAAAVLDHVATRVAQKDPALSREVANKLVGAHAGAVEAALLLVINATSHPDPREGCAHSSGAKAHATEAALSAVNDLAPLLGAESYEASSAVDKVSRDLRAFQFADGANDALLRYAGRKYLENSISEPLEEVSVAGAGCVERG